MDDLARIRNLRRRMERLGDLRNLSDPRVLSAAERVDRLIAGWYRAHEAAQGREDREAGAN